MAGAALGEPTPCKEDRQRLCPEFTNGQRRSMPEEASFGPQPCLQGQGVGQM